MGIEAFILSGYPHAAEADLFARHVLPGGTLVLAGVLERQAADVWTAFTPYFDGLAPGTRDGWVRLKGRRKGG